MGLYSGGLIIGRISASEIWGAYFWEGLFIHYYYFLFWAGGGGGYYMYMWLLHVKTKTFFNEPHLGWAVFGVLESAGDPSPPPPPQGRIGLRLF